MGNEQATGITEERSERNQEEEAVIPPPIEEVACRHKEQVLPAQRFEHKPIEQKDDRQEKDTALAIPFPFCTRIQTDERQIVSILSFQNFPDFDT